MESKIAAVNADKRALQESMDRQIAIQIATKNQTLNLKKYDNHKALPMGQFHFNSYMNERNRITNQNINYHHNYNSAPEQISISINQQTTQNVPQQQFTNQNFIQNDFINQKDSGQSNVYQKDQNFAAKSDENYVFLSARAGFIRKVYCILLT